MTRQKGLIKQFVFVLIITAAFFGGLEMTLALFGIQPISSTEDPLVGFAGNNPLFVEDQQGGKTILTTAKNKIDFFNPQTFPKLKQETSYRIFCMGGSTTFGRPYDDRTSFCGWLRSFLQAADPSRNWPSYPNNRSR